MFATIGNRGLRSVKPRSFVAAVALIVGSICAPAVHAATFTDNFNADPGALNATNFNGLWTVSQGTVDLIPVDSQFNFYPGNGEYVDLNGSSNAYGGLSTVQTFGPGTYTLTFNLGGSFGGQGMIDPTSKETLVNLGGFQIADITLAPNAGFTSQSFTFTTGTGGVLNFTSVPGGNANVGNILDNVSLTTTPLPSTWLMLLSGFLGIGYFAYRGTKTSRAVLAPA